ncbi:MAG: hypothetical protein ACLPY5_00075 [Candidatus Bathyarchaeia archaeon]
MDESKIQTTINELKHILSHPLVLLSKYLRNEVCDILPVGYDGFLLLFFIIDSLRGFFPTSEQHLEYLGKYRLRVRLYSYEIKPTEYRYELDIRNWNSFDLKQLPKFFHHG